LKETQAIEKATAQAFIELYNLRMGTSFSIVEYSDAPDIRCKDSLANAFNLEITLTEDRTKDIQAALGRSNHRSLEALKQHLKDVSARRASPSDRASCLQGNVTEMIVSRIRPKLKKDYGRNVALVVRDTSPIGWDWVIVLDQIKHRLNRDRNPFDKGIWIITFRMDDILRVL
jgi:hypothetical protein